MKYFTNPIVDVTILVVIVVLGYYTSTLRHAARGCHTVERWSKRVSLCMRYLLIVAASIPFAAFTLVPFARLLTLLLSSLDLAESRFFAGIIGLFAFGKYTKALDRAMKVGNHNGRAKAGKTARACRKKCSVVCECAGWGETVLDCCQDPISTNCPLAGQYEIHVRFQASDVGEALCQAKICKHEAAEATFTSTSIEVPYKFVLVKEFDTVGWEAELNELFADTKPATTSITEDVSPAPQPEPVVQPAEPETVKVIEKPHPRRLAFNKAIFRRDGYEFLMEDFTQFTKLVVVKKDSDGERKELTFFKDSPEYPQGVRALIAAGMEAFNAVEQLKNSPATVATAF